MSKVSQLYSLPEEERKALLKATALSEGLLLALAVMGAVVLSGLKSGDWLEALAFGWLSAIGEELAPHWLAVVLPILLVLLVVAIDACGLRLSQSYRAAKRNLVQGLNGELPRLGLHEIAFIAIAAGMVEELLFRYVLIGLLMLAFSLFAAPAVAAVLSLAVSTAVFVVVHLQYRDPWSISLVSVLGLLLGTGYLLSGSLLAVMIAHAAYDAAIVLYERRKMVRDPEYFCGCVPNSYCLDLGRKDEVADN